MSRLPTDYTELVEESEGVLDADDLLDIELKAGILEFNECLEYLLVEKEDLSEAEYNYAKRIHKRGRNKSVYEIFEQLRKNSTSAAEMMITRLSTVLAAPVLDTIPTVPFQLNVDLSIDDKTKTED